MSVHVLMCEPTHYRIAYEINPWMRRINRVDPARAREQWTALRDILVRLGVRVELVEQQPEVPDMVFTANAGIVMGRRFVVSNFRFPERQPEADHFARWFAGQGYEVLRVPGAHAWEGEGDVLSGAGPVFAAHGFRTDPQAFDELEVALGEPVVRLELVDPRFYHLDTCFFPVAEGLAAYFPPAFSQESRRLLHDRVRDLIEVDEHDALRFACNALRVGEQVVLNSGCGGMVAALARRGYRCIETPMDEFIKAGGSVKCLVLELDGFASGQRAARP